jgi:hypothetical protein
MNDAAIHGVDLRLLYGLRGILTKSRSGRESVNFRSAAFLPGLTLQNAGVARLEIKNEKERRSVAPIGFFPSIPA